MGGIPSAIDLLKQRDQRITELEAALRAIQTMTREFVEANEHPTMIMPSEAFWRIAHVEKIARKALGEADTTP